MRDNRLYLIHIGECLRRIQEYMVAGKQVFTENARQQS